MPAGELQAIRLSTVDAETREQLIRAYERDVYGPAFPDAEIREDPGYWLGLLGADPYPPPPQPKIEVVLLLDGDMVAGGVTVELYRTARCGLLTYISIHPERRGQGLGRQLVGHARAALTGMAGSEVLMFAETERLEDAQDDAERIATILRQTQLSGLGAKLVDYEYWMPPLRPGLPAHRLHLMAFDPPADTVPAATVAALMAELAEALGADMDAHDETRAMMAWLAGQDSLPVRPLPAAQPR